MNSEAVFSLENFNGSLDFLIHLIDKHEVDISEVPVRSLVSQFAERMPVPVDAASEWLYDISYLVWLKSKLLLPVHEQVVQKEDEPDPQFEIIHHLVDYCRFRDVAKTLTARQEDQSAYFVRGLAELDEKKRKPLDPLPLEKLTELLKEMLKKAPLVASPIQEEPWKISDKLHEIRSLLKSKCDIPFLELFNYHRPRLELIVIFLALLELMKRGEAIVTQEGKTNIWFISGRYE